MPCPQHSSTNGRTGAASVADCVCLPGFELVNTSPLTCSACTTGRFKEQHDIFPCEPCPAGTIANVLVAATTCVDCVNGELCDGGTAYPKVCPAGSQCPTPAFEEPCREGFVCTNRTQKASVKCNVDGCVCSPTANNHVFPTLTRFCAGIASRGVPPRIAYHVRRTAPPISAPVPPLWPTASATLDTNS